MFITDLFAKKKAVMSFEIFPPKQTSSIDVIYDTIDALVPLYPDYISVTYGAAGSTTNTTAEIAAIIENKYNINALAHLTCVSSNKNEINLSLKHLADCGVNNILALRGDEPKDATSAEKIRDFSHASDLVAYVHNNYALCLGGACYPEGHPESSDLDTDIENLKRKVDAGVGFLITQLFFDNDTFYRFRDKIERKGIKIPIQAGIMPVTNRQQIERIVELTNAKVPRKLTAILDKFEHNKEAVKDAGIAFATEQIIELLSNDIDGIHLYTMNRPQVAKDIVWNLKSLFYAINN